ncbi:hypothetical protein C1H46_039249 [Malus baccata]|uniref:Uncharacterized protein n=1 Tax=Malus baccata TaxID=106549 RepID=A0A540KLW0_MALBA|nr:hypothetical protein C1H46_039249 [Malus baccata]
MSLVFPILHWSLGPNSGILVVKDEETTCCFELSNIDLIKELPFLQNKSLELYYATWFYPNRDLQFHGVFFIPVLGPYGKDEGEGYTSANEDSMDMETCRFDRCTNDAHSSLD